MSKKSNFWREYEVSFQDFVWKRLKRMCLLCYGLQHSTVISPLWNPVPKHITKTLTPQQLTHTSDELIHPWSL